MNMRHIFIGSIFKHKPCDIRISYAEFMSCLHAIKCHICKTQARKVIIVWGRGGLLILLSKGGQSVGNKLLWSFGNWFFLNKLVKCLQESTDIVRVFKNSKDFSV